MWHDDTHVFWRSVKGEGVTDEEIITLIDLDRISRSCKWMSYNCPLLLSVTSDCCRSYKTCFTVRASKFEDWFMIKIHQHLRFSDSSPLMAVGVSKVQIKMTVACWVSRRCPWFSVRATPTWRTKRCHWSHPMGSEEGRYMHNWIVWSKNETRTQTFKLKLSLKSSAFFGEKTNPTLSQLAVLFREIDTNGDLTVREAHWKKTSHRWWVVIHLPRWTSRNLPGADLSWTPKKSEYLEQKDNVGWFSAVWMLGGSSVWCGFSKMFYSRKGDVKKYIATNT